jgi:cellulose synthase/poly-beta-1,6-N-acetylglucosamine synthase-like glycosyltransferase
MRISLLIPAHNEERSIRSTINSCISQTRPFDEIVVVNDGSTDNTQNILESFGDKIKVVTIPLATGNKSHAQQEGLKYITGDIFVATDGDTILHKDFVKMIEPHFENSDVTAVSGYVTSIKNNWITACREIDYIIGQNIHKRAQSIINYIFVIPGCAGAFRSNTFNKQTMFDHDTLTEDLDFTYKIHKQYSKVVFEPKAIAYTQDPFTLSSYINQMRRWYSGGWQNLLKHVRSIIHRPAVAFELSLTYIEGITFSILIFILPFLRPMFFVRFVLLYLIFLMIVGAVCAYLKKRLDLFTYSPFLLVLTFINSWVFLEQFFLEVLMQNRKKIWFKPERKLITEL